MDNKEFLVAFATDNGKNFIEKHFGDAEYFLIYKMVENGFSYIDTIKNNSEEEKKHADPKKAKSISKILKAKNVHILVGKAFGGNIVRMKKKFVCIKCNLTLIENSFELLLNNFNQILSQWEKGEERDFIVL